jgi:hypothetical protein
LFNPITRDSVLFNTIANFMQQEEQLGSCCARSNKRCFVDALSASHFFYSFPFSSAMQQRLVGGFPIPRTFQYLHFPDVTVTRRNITAVTVVRVSIIFLTRPRGAATARRPCRRPCRAVTP